MANSAPILDNTQSPVIGNVAENNLTDGGVDVNGIVVNTSITDVDGVVEAIAITALNASLGVWQYRLTPGGNWFNINVDLLNSSTTEMALLLGPSNTIRLLPFGDLNGTLNDAITFRAWDQSTGAEGTYVDVSSNGGTSAFSSASDTASFTLYAINDAPTFSPMSGGGKTVVPVSSGSNGILSSVVQNDGKLLFVGYARTGAASTEDFAVMRLNTDGTLDTSFSTDGLAIFALNASNEDRAVSVNLQSSGKIVVSGYVINSGSSYDFAVMRLNTDGSIDTSFGASGYAIVPIQTSGVMHDIAQSAVIQSDNKILVLGHSMTGGTNWELSLTRLNEDGSLDTSFDTDGKLILTGGSNQDLATSVKLQSDGKILVAGSNNNAGTFDFTVKRLNVDGSLDTSFNTTGARVISLGGADYLQNIDVLSDGKILLTGFIDGASGDFKVIRLNSDGTDDVSFGTTGTSTISFGADDRANSAAIQNDGSILVAGGSYDGSTWNFSLTRLSSNGSVDTSFGTSGKVTLAVGSGHDIAYSVKALPDGKIILSGSSATTNDNFAVVRLNADGSLDTSFNGTATATLGGTVAFTYGETPIALDSSVAIYDLDLAASGNYAGAVLSLARNGGANSQDLFSANGNLSFSAGNVILSATTIGTVSNTGGTLTITFNSNATQARVNEALSSISYANSQNSTASVTIDWTFSDGNTASGQGVGGQLSATGSTTVNVTAGNNAPINTLPASYTTNEDTNVALSGLSIADVDAASGAMTVTLNVGSGSLTATTGAGVTVGGSGSSTITLDGTLANINTFLAGGSAPAYVPAANANGAVTLSMTTSDQGNTGPGGILTDVD
uniref:beta strand repeat-containing protein n=1 Tax=Undibacterium sp. TaxID=1914977 RepID=UPI003750E755